MARPQDFPQKTKDEIWDRQEGRCADCGHDLNESYGKPEVHHVGRGVGYPEDDPFSKSADNGVYLCKMNEDGDECHLEAHNRSTKDGPDLVADEFKYSQGNDQAGHDSWAQDHAYRQEVGHAEYLESQQPVWEQQPEQTARTEQVSQD